MARKYSQRDILCLQNARLSRALPVWVSFFPAGDDDCEHCLMIGCGRVTAPEEDVFFWGVGR